MLKQIIGKVDKDIADRFNIPEYANKKIVLYPNDKKHCEKRHLRDFSNSKHFYYVMSNLDIIINKPDVVLYNKKNSSLEYYKNIGQDISVRVRVENGPELKVKTFFPVEKEKMEEKKAKAKFITAYNKYVVEDNN